MPTIELLTSDKLEDRAFHTTSPVALDFYHASCAPCRTLEPRLERVAQQYAGRLPVYRVDIERDMAVTKRFVLSLGYDITQPLLAGIVTELGGDRPGQAMGLNVCLLFTSFGAGSFLFGEALRLGFGGALAIFSAVRMIAAVAAVVLFRLERPASISLSDVSTS